MSEGQKEGLIHQSYHVLFIIYAPIALLSIVLNLFSDKYINYVFLFALLASAASVVVAVMMWIKFWQHRELIAQERKANLPYLIRHQFILLYLPIAFASMGLSAYFVYDKYVKTVEEHKLSALKKVSLLVPLETPLGRELEDSEQIKRGVGAFVVNNPDFDDQYHLDVIDHNNEYSNEFEAKLVTRLEQGTRYLVCAYSEVCSQLGERVPVLSEELGLAQTPIVITTLASAMDLPLAKDQFYRFYPRNLEDTQALAKAAFDAGIKAMDIVATDDAYGKDAVEQFTTVWQNFGHSVGEVLLLDPELTEEVASEKIRESTLGKSQSEGVFVALYQPANESLAELAKRKTLFLSANYQQHKVRELIESGASPKRLFVSMPQYKAYDNKAANMAGMFVYATLEKLFQVDQALNGQSLEHEKDFHSLWLESKYPQFMEFEVDSENDLKILMKAEPFDQTPFSGSAKTK